MPITVGHSKVLTMPDDPDVGQVKPSDWNSNHVVTLSLASNEVVKYVVAGATNNTMSSGTLSFGDSNGVTFGLATSNGQLTASVRTDYQPAGPYLTTAQPVGAYLTTAALSQDSSKYAGLNFAGTNVSGTLNTSGLSLSVAAPGGGGDGYNIIAAGGTTAPNSATVNFANSNGVSFGLVTTGGSTQVTATVATNYQSQGAYLTTAANSTHTHGAPSITGSIGITSNSNAWSISIPAFLTTAQAPGAYLTTARASNDAVGLNTAFTGNGALATINSSGISLNLSAHLTTAMASNAGSNFAGLSTGATNASVTLNSQGIAISVNPGGGAGDGYNIIAAGGVTAPTSATVAFTNSNGVSFGLVTTGGSTYVSATVATNYQSQGAYLTTARASNDAIGLNTALTANGLSVTANSSGLSINVPAYLTTAAQSSHSHGMATTTTNGAAVVVATANSAGYTLAIPAFLTTAQAPGAYLTTARASNDAIGLNTAFTGNGALATINSSGLSLSLPAFLTTAMLSNAGSNFAGLNFAGTNITATLNSSGLSLSVAAPGGGGTTNQTGPNIADSVSTVTSGTVVFANGNGVSFGLNGATMTATVATNYMASNAGSNFAGLSTGATNASVTLNSQGIAVSVAAPGGGGAGTIGGWEPNAAGNNTTFSSLGQNSLYLQKIVPMENVSFNNLELRMSGSYVSTSVSHAVSHTLSYGLYSLNTANDSYGLLGSSSIVINASNSSNASYAMTVSQGATQFTNSSLGTVNASLMSGLKHLYLPYTGTLTAGVNYGVALLMSSTSTVGGSPLRIALLEQSIINNLTMGKIYASTALGSNASFVGDYAQGVYGTTTGALPSSIAKSQMTNQVSQARLYLQFEV